jgi:hypothetical protein
MTLSACATKTISMTAISIDTQCGEILQEKLQGS